MALTIVKKDISLNVGQPNNFELICAMQDDNKTFEITATLYDVNKLYTINTDNIKIRGVNPVGLKIEEKIDKHTTNTVTFTLTEKMLMYDGILKLVIIFTDNGQLTTFPFVIKVINSPGSSTVDDVKTISELVEEAKKWANLSKSYAVGTDNIVRPDDKTDNSKYYYELAKKFAEDAKKYFEQATGSADDFSYYYELIKTILENNSFTNIVYYDTYDEFQTDLQAGNIPPETLICIKENKLFFSVRITKGDNMSWDSASGAEIQHDIINSMIPVIYMAKDGYYFPTDYTIPSVNGITVTRNSGTKITVSGTPTGDTQITLKAPNKFYAVKVVKAANMTWDSSSGKETQSDSMGAITPIIYISNSGYFFPSDYSVASVNGISVTRNSDNKITVSGTPTNDTQITLKAPNKQKGIQNPPTGLSDGILKINGTTSAMEYAASPNASSWTSCSNGNTTVPAGTWYVRYKETDELYASSSVSVVVTEDLAETDVTFEPGTFVCLGYSGGATTYSTDKGVTWKVINNPDFLLPVPLLGVCNAIHKCNGKYYVLRSKSGTFTIYQSSTLKKWSELYNNPSFSSQYYLDRLYYDSKIMLLGGAFNNSYYSTDNGMNWAKTDIPISTTEVKLTSATVSEYKILNFCSNDNSMYVAGGYRGHCYYSSNGKNWSEIAGISNENLYIATYHNGAFYLIGIPMTYHDTYTGKIRVYSSTNGSSWTKIIETSNSAVKLGSSADERDGIWFNDKYLFMYNDGSGADLKVKILVINPSNKSVSTITAKDTSGSSFTANSFKYSGFVFNNELYIIDNGNRCYKTSDITNWTKVSTDGYAQCLNPVVVV